MINESENIGGSAFAVYEACANYRLLAKNMSDEGLVPAMVSGSEREYLYQVVDAGKTGLNAKQLRALFEEDQKSKYSRQFFHQNGDDDTNGAIQWGAPDYADELNLRRLGSVRYGVKRSKEGNEALHQLFARKPNGDVLGFIEFTLRISPYGQYEADPRQYYRENPSKPVEVAMTVSLNRIYVRKRYRGRGAAEAMLSCLGYAVCEELGQMKALLRPIAEANKVPVLIEPTLYSDWCSRSGKVAHYKALLHMESSCDLFRYDDNYELDPYFLVDETDSDGGY